jgi:hypothetical protein
VGAVGINQCDAAVRRGRKKKAMDFLTSAQALGILVDTPNGTDSYVQLCALAGIAASDVICCAKYGYHHQGDDHNAAVALLRSVDKTSAKHLTTLLGMKTRTGYAHNEALADDRKRAERAATALVEEAMKY